MILDQKIVLVVSILDHFVRGQKNKLQTKYTRLLEFFKTNLKLQTGI